MLLHTVFAGYQQLVHRMKIKQEQLQRLAHTLVASYQAKDLMVAKVPQAEIEAKIIAIVSQNFAEEEALEEEARKVLAGHAQATRDMDSYKMFLLAKQKLAAKKGFVL
jgi:hypothetical protein